MPLRIDKFLTALSYFSRKLRIEMPSEEYSTVHFNAEARLADFNFQLVVPVYVTTPVSKSKVAKRVGIEMLLNALT